MGELGQLQKEIRAVAQVELQQLGFRRRALVFVKELAEGIYGWVGLAEAVYREGKYVTISPNVGVHYRMLTLIEDGLMARNSAKHWAATVARNVGYLYPGGTYKNTEFYPGDNVAAKVKSIIADINDYGVPWMHELIDLDVLEQAVRKHVIIDYAAFIVPIIWLFKGDKETAIKFAIEFQTMARENNKRVHGYDEFIAQLQQWEGI